MKGAVSWVVLAVATASWAEAQGPYQQQKSFRFTGDSLARYEWTRKIPTSGGLVDEDRYRVQLRPRLEAVIGFLELGVGGEFNYSEDENDEPPEGQPLLIVRDNYRSRDARFDLYYGTLNAGPIVATGGRFVMPLPLSEMIWDRDLRPQGGALALQFEEGSGRFALHGIYATGSHVFADDSEMFGGSVELELQSGQTGELQLGGSYLEFRDLDALDPFLRRQNTTLAGVFLHEYKVIDVRARIVSRGQFPIELVADYCWNRALEENNKGLWLAAALGELGVSRARLEYTYSKIDRNAVVAAFNTDDFFWGTGWEGHRADLGSATSRSASLHAIAQWQRFKDSPDPEVQNQWVERYRVEVRVKF